MAEHESDKSRFVYTINGVKVVFPCKAYPTQLSMMNMIIKGIERRQNSLLESPTGSGKSLALLCSCLAWQSAEYEKKEKLEREENAAEALEANGCCDDACGAEELSPQTGFQMNSKSEYFQHDTSETAKNSTELHKSDNNTEKVFSPPQSSDESESHVGNFASGSLSDDDFQPAKKRLRTPGNQVAPSKKRRVQTSLESSSCEDESNSDPPETTTDTTAGENISPDSKDYLENKEKCCTDSGDKIKSAKIKVPKIFFGTRTHKQIAQISRELRKTEYKKVRMTILSSREHSCVHPTVSKGKNKNEECRLLLDGKAGPGATCKYYQKVNTIKTQTSLKYHGLIEAWDVEDLVTLGNRIRACPYYAARELMKEADIIFCPYNYLIDPKIRMQMEINLRDQLVVLDEAHNVEDSARDAASLTLTAVDLQNVLEDLDKLVQKQVLTENHRALHVMTGSFLRWIHESSSQLKERGFEQSSKVWSGMEIIEVMEKQGITSGTFLLYFEHFQFVMASAKDPKRQGMPSLSTHSSTLLEGIFLIGKYMMGYNMKYILDYRCAVLQTSVMVRNTQVMPGGWRRSHGGMRKEWTHSLNFWCLNPAVVFSELGSEARCIILTSGTLSPMASFSSELGVKFPIHLEANHVVASSQVWVGTLASGPSGCAVNASYQSSETFTFQDEVGKAVLNICETVPHGVLCFFPSYNMLDKLSKRWQVTGLWSKLLDKKKIVSEPRGGDKLEFDDIMHQFYDAVRTSEDEECTDSDSDVESSVDGGLFLAVCRGKVSEGLDFADNNARAVITIGIPFPNVKDIQVELKRKYNTQYSASRGLLTGSEWYEIQAYRALNQALGRCIRHKQDWGAILLIDERFNKSSKYTNGISKWVRKRIIKYDDFGEAMTSLKQFTTARKLDPCPTPVVASQSLLCASFLETPTKETNLNFDRNLSMDSTPLSKVPRTHDAGFTPGHSVNGDLLKRVGADTPAKPINVHTDAKSSQESSSLCKIQISESSLPVLTLQSSANAERLDEIPEIRVADGSFVKQEGNANLSVKVEQSAYTDAMRIQRPQLIEVPDNQSGVAPHSPRIDIICADGTPKNQKFVSSHRKSLEKGTQERKVFNGRTLVLDCSQKNGLSLGKGKFRKPLKPHENRESTVSDCTKTKNSGGEGFLEEQCCSSPELFATPSTSPLSSSSKQGDSELAISESEDRTCVKLESTDLACREKSKIESTENQAINVGRDSDKYEGEDTEKSEGLVKQDMVETSVTTDTNNETVPPERNLHFRSKVTLCSNALQQRDFLDDVNDDFPVKGSEIKIECDPTPLEVSSKRVERSCGSVSKESSNEPRNRRRSMRLRKKLNTARTSSKTREENNEVDGDRAFLFCTQCGAGLVKGSVTPKPIPKDTPDVILQAVGGEKILIIDRQDSEVLNLCPWFATDKINSTGLKLNSLFVPKTDTCYIPQVCRRCHSTSKDSPMVGFEFVSFGSSSLIKQIWLFPSVVYVGNH